MTFMGRFRGGSTLGVFLFYLVLGKQSLLIASSLSCVSGIIYSLIRERATVC